MNPLRLLLQQQTIATETPLQVEHGPAGEVCQGRDAGGLQRDFQLRPTPGMSPTGSGARESALPHTAARTVMACGTRPRTASFLAGINRDLSRPDRTRDTE